MARAFSGLGGYIRHKSKLDPRLRELAILQVGWLEKSAYGVGVIVFAGVVNAVRNVPQIFIDNARALGASRLQLYRTVVLPAILPAMRSVVLLSLGAGWGAVLAAEYLGAQSGLGYIIVYAQQFGLLDRMFLIAILFILYTSASYWVIQRLFARLLVWAPSSQSA
jgi:sulfonate transport system permease protein